MKIAPELNQLPPENYRDTKTSAKMIARNDFQKLLNEIKGTNTNKPQYSTTPRTSAATPPAPQRSQPGGNPDNTVTVKDGDTLFNIAQKALQSRGLEAGSQESMRTALQLARENGLANANLILPGQKISLSSIGMPEIAKTMPGDLPSTISPRFDSPQSASARTDQRQPVNKARVAANPVLEKTLDRAVKLQYFTAEEKDAVRNKVLKLAAEHNFTPDDLAVVTLIESDGMNPKASNGRCHGIIQFCDGASRGAASVGYKDNPKAILDLPVVDQLDLIGKYFEETGLKSFGKRKPASLDDLYLTVLTPAARRERNMNTYLDIAGQQATVLRASAEPDAPITRNTLVKGLLQNAREKLSAGMSALTVPVKPQTIKVSSIEPFENKNPL